MNAHSSVLAPKLAPVLAPQLTTLKNVGHAFFTRPGGVSAGIYAGLNAGLGSDDEREHVIENRNRMAGYLGTTSETLATPYQIHSPDVVYTNQAWSSDRPKADGIVTDQPGLAIGVVTADCGPVLFADQYAGVVGAAHAGWNGALNGVLLNTIVHMEKKGAQRKNITAILGPTISQDNYEVGPDFPAPFLAQSSTNSRYFRPSNNEHHHMFDLTGYIVDQLKSADIDADTVQRCTYAETDNFYSYRRTTHREEADYGRQLSAIVLRAT